VLATTTDTRSLPAAKNVEDDAADAFLVVVESFDRDRSPQDFG
jgi:hypothetical protein